MLFRSEAMGLRGVVLKSHWWPTINVVPYIAAAVKTKVEIWSSVTMNATAGGPNPCLIEAAAELGGKMAFLPTWSARNDVEHKGFSHRIKSYYQSHDKLENPLYFFLDDKGKLIQQGYEILEACKAHDMTLGMGHVSWQESLAFIAAAREMVQASGADVLVVYSTMWPSVIGHQILRPDQRSVVHRQAEQAPARTEANHPVAVNQWCGDRSVVRTVVPDVGFFEGEPPSLLSRRRAEVRHHVRGAIGEHRDDVFTIHDHG